LQTCDVFAIVPLHGTVQVSEEAHSVALSAALGANASMHDELQQRLSTLEQTERSLFPSDDPSRPWQSTDPVISAAHSSPIEPQLLGKSQFLTDEAYKDYIHAQQCNVRAARASVENMPQFSGVLRVEKLSLQGLGGPGKKRNKRMGLFSCCLNPKLELDEEELGDSLFFKTWLSVRGEKADKQRHDFSPTPHSWF
jgi:hypothetical protein